MNTKAIAFKSARELIDRAEEEQIIMVLFVSDGKDTHLVTNVPVTAKTELHRYLLKAAAMVGEFNGN